MGLKKLLKNRYFTGKKVIWEKKRFSIGMGNNPEAQATVACAVAVYNALK